MASVANGADEARGKARVAEASKAKVGNGSKKGNAADKGGKGDPRQAESIPEGII